MEWIQKEIEDNGVYYIQKSFNGHLLASNKAKFTIFNACGKSREITENKVLKYSLFKLIT